MAKKVGLYEKSLKQGKGVFFEKKIIEKGMFLLSKNPCLGQYFEVGG